MAGNWAVRNPCLEIALAELESAGIRGVERTYDGKHPQLRWRVNGGTLRIYAVPGTPSDMRSPLNVRANIRRLLRADGVAVGSEKTELPPAPRKPYRITEPRATYRCVGASNRRVEIELTSHPLHESFPLREAADSGASVQHVLHRDCETRSRALLKLVGTHKYAADPSTEILFAAYAVDDDPLQLWLPDDPLPPEFIEAAHNPSWAVAAHGDHFETAIERHILALRFGFPLVPLERHRCTMAIALAAGLPARLDRIALALELSNRKDAAGERLMHQMSKPRRAHKDEDPDQVYWFDDQERLDRLYEYCRRDTEVEREIYRASRRPGC